MKKKVVTLEDYVHKKKDKRKEFISTWVIVLVVLIALLGLFALVVYLIGTNYSGNNGLNDANSSLPDNYVVRVIDGDTFELASGNTVRLICVDAPELGKANSLEAKQYLESLILDKEVRLEKDVSEMDEYRRLLRYAYINNSAEELFVNKEMVNQGYASVWRYSNDTKRCDEIEG